MNWEVLLPAIISGLTGSGVTAIILKIIEQRHQKPVTDASAEKLKADADEVRERILSESWETVSKEYARMLEGKNALEVENRELRPLVLKLALQEKEMEQVKEDKEDWKRYASKLSKQLEEHKIIPLPFRRYPGNGDSEKVKAVTQVDIHRVETHEKDKP